MADDSLALALALPDASPRTLSPTQLPRQWRVGFARYFSTPLPLGPFRHDKLQPKKVGRRKGTWLTAAAEAVVELAASGSGGAAVVSVTVGSVVFEEHFVHILGYSWPQVSCVPECPVRGSRAIFVSYSDGTNKMNKFALRFRGASDAEEFLECVKQCICEKKEFDSTRSVSVHLPLSVELFAPSRHLSRTDLDSIMELAFGCSDEEEQIQSDEDKDQQPSTQIYARPNANSVSHIPETQCWDEDRQHSIWPSAPRNIKPVSHIRVTECGRKNGQPPSIQSAPRNIKLASRTSVTQSGPKKRQKPFGSTSAPLNIRTVSCRIPVTQSEAKMDGQPVSHNSVTQSGTKMDLQSSIQICAPPDIKPFSHHMPVSQCGAKKNQQPPIQTSAPLNVQSVSQIPVTDCCAKKDKQPSLQISAPPDVNPASHIPPSFTGLMASCASVSGNGPALSSNISFEDLQSVLQVFDKSSCDAPTSADGSASLSSDEIVARLNNFMAEDSFHEMLSKLEGMIEYLGGDMRL